MWVSLAFLSATLLGFYDAFKKYSVRNNAVLPVLFLNTLFSCLIFLPFILISHISPESMKGGLWYVTSLDWHTHLLVVVKSLIVLSSWILGYIAIKYLPLTLVGPVNATRPILVLIGATLIFGERMNVYQWIGVLLAIFSLFLLSRSGKKEGIDFRHNKWILCLFAAALMGAISGLYDKFLMKHYPPMSVQAWYACYQLLIMAPVLLLLWFPKRKQGTPFQWRWSILAISIFLSCADVAYFYALSDKDALITIVSMIRRGSVVISFLMGAIFFHEKNLKSKAIDLLLVLIGLLFLYWGSR